MQIFTKTKNWSFTKADSMAEEKFKILQQKTIKQLPESFYSIKFFTQLENIRRTALYKLMKTIPKGVLHHTHYFCNDDRSFYQRYILTDSRFYLNSTMKSFEVGTAQEAKEKGWISMEEGIKKYGEKKWLDIIVGLTCFTQEELQKITEKPEEVWTMFEGKIVTPGKLFLVADIFQKYSRHILLKYKANGYQRIEVRTSYKLPKVYDQKGNYIRDMETSQFFDTLEKIIDEVSGNQAQLFFGWIICGYKIFDVKVNEEKFRAVCKAKWKLFVGFDFVNQEDQTPPLSEFDPLVDQIQEEFPDLCHLKKVYHAGETCCHRTNNIDTAIKAGSVRIGHALNILQRPQILPHCKNVCIQKNPLSNLILGYDRDIRHSSTPLLVGMGYPVSISPDDPGKFWCDDATEDYFVAATAYNWNLKHLKLIAYHSINHALCDESIKNRLVKEFNSAWDKWIQEYLGFEKMSPLFFSHHVQENNEIFKTNLHWNFLPEEQMAEQKFNYYRTLVEDNTEEQRWQINGIQFLKLMKEIENTQLYQSISSMPKGVLHSCHLHFCHDRFFFLQCPIDYEDFWLTRQGKVISCHSSEVQLKNCVRLSMVKEEMSEKLFSKAIYSLTSLSTTQLLEIKDEQDFWNIVNKKKSNFMTFLQEKYIFEGYVAYALEKLSKMGYSRVELKVEPINLQIDGVELPISAYFTAIKKAVDFIKRNNSQFSVGLIVLGNKNKSKKQNSQLLEDICFVKSPLLVGFDFEQSDPEDKFSELSYFDQMLEDVLLKYDECDAVKIYQAGNTRRHDNNNVKMALQAGASRITNASNILQFTQIIPRCKKTCFEVNPIHQFLSRSTGRQDFRHSLGDVLLRLKVPVSVGWEYGGLFGIETSWNDLTMIVASSNWSLKDLKLVFLNSIDYAACGEGLKIKMRNQFSKEWSRWILNYLK